MAEHDILNEEGQVTEAPDIGTLAVLNKSEIDQQIATAKKYPRSIVDFRKEALQLATLDEQTAAECIYALPRDGKTIEGPSARFAEIVNYSWGNTRAGARTLSEDGDFVKSQGLFYDLEKNTAISYEISRRIIDKKGNRYKADMIGTTSNAACSIALRNAILKGIPKALWKPIYDAARKVVAGDFSTLANRREEALKAFAIYGVTPEAIYATLGVKGKEDITIDHMVILKGILTAIQEGDTTPELAFAAPSPAGTTQQESAEDRALREQADKLLQKYYPEMNAAKRQMQISRYQGRMPELLAKLKENGCQNNESPRSSAPAEATSSARSANNGQQPSSVTSRSESETSATQEHATPKSAPNAQPASGQIATTAPSTKGSDNIHGVDITDDDLPDNLFDQTPPKAPAPAVSHSPAQSAPGSKKGWDF